MATYQKSIFRIDQFSSELPQNYEIIDFKSRAHLYDSFVYDFEKTGTFLPLIWEDETFDTYGIAAYVGDYRNGQDGTQEAVTSIAAVLSASLLGIDKSNQNGFNFVHALNVFFNQEEKVVINNPSGNSRNISMWYMIYPAILFTQVSLLYEDEVLLRENALTTIESWYQAYTVMNNQNNYDYTGFNFQTMQPYKNNIWTEPDSAVGISLLMYYGYQLTANEKYKTAAIDTMTYIDKKYSGSPMYEILLYFAPYLAARYNQEFDTNFDVNRLFNLVFNGNSIPRGGWGMLNDNYNGFAVSGLMGSITDGGGYAFSMNSFAAAFIMAKTVKYDTRFASSVGKWLNHLISNSRYFFPDYAKDENETMYLSEFSEDTIKFNDLANNIFPYEGIRKSGSAKTPWFGGDPTVYGWAQTDFSIYSGASIGMLGSLYEKTNVDGILKIDLNQGDFFNEEEKTYLLYNPYETNQTVNYIVDGTKTLYDKVTDKIISENVSGTYQLELSPKQSVIIVELPVNANLTKTDKLVIFNDRVINAYQATLSVISHENNAEVSKKFKLKLQTVINNKNDTVDYYEVILDGKLLTFKTDEFQLETTSGSKTITIKVYTKGGLFDQTTLRISVS
ncbi:hypothetical protein [Acholeplasma hippikon]|nr:hypothetical protein [Acholeplasma hippikon]